MRQVALTGSASGIGAAVRKRLEKAGDKVIGVDLRDADVIADLARPDGRARAMAGIREQSGGRLDGLVVCAGVGPHVEPWSLIVSLNYFGSQVLLDGLRDLLAAGSQPAAVAVASNSCSLPGVDSPMVDACLAGNEGEARRIVLEMDAHRAYAGSKLALVRWIRRNAPGPDWAGKGIRLNAVAPGVTMTPLVQAGLAHPVFGPAIQSFPVPLGGFANPDQIAPAITFLLGPESSFCCGSVLFVDGGTDAMFRADTP